MCGVALLPARTRPCVGQQTRCEAVWIAEAGLGANTVKRIDRPARPGRQVGTGKDEFNTRTGPHMVEIPDGRASGREGEREGEGHNVSGQGCEKTLAGFHRLRGRQGCTK